MCAQVPSSFDAERFRQLGHRLVDQLTDYLLTVTDRREYDALPWVDPDELAEQWPVVDGRPEQLDELITRVVNESTHLHHPGYVGHQVTSPLPLASLGSFLGSFLNSANAVYEMGPAATAIEHNVIAWMAGQIGFGDDADGVLTSGGSLGNLTALLAARQAQAGHDVWTEGEAGGQPLALLVGAWSHYSVSRAAQVMGLGKVGIYAVEADTEFRTRPEALPAALAAARRDGRQPIAVCTSSCCTATGSFDPLEPIAEFCAQEGLWLHVDGAHGASAVLSPKYRHLTAGLDQADSVVWDAHKMMLMPALCTAVLYRDGRRSYEAFAQEASYLLHKRDPREEWYNLCGRTVECTKPMLGLPLYLALAAYGSAMFGDYVTYCFDLGRRFGEILSAELDFELPVRPDGNIICFRWLPGQETNLDELQARIRMRIIEDGGFYPVQTKLPDGIYLRTTLINPLTTEADLLELIRQIRTVGRSLLKGG